MLELNQIVLIFCLRLFSNWTTFSNASTYVLYFLCVFPISTSWTSVHFASDEYMFGACQWYSIGSFNDFFLFKFYFDFGLISDTRIDRQGLFVSTESSNCKFDGHMNDLYIQCNLMIYFFFFFVPCWFFFKMML